MTLENDRLKSLVPWKGHPRGVICPRGVKGPEITYSEDRLTQPLKRVGPRGSGKFETTTWDEALDDIANRLKDVVKTHGPESLTLYTGRGTFERALCDQLTPAGVKTSSAWTLFFPLGAINTTGVGSICYVSHGVIAPAVTHGLWRVQTEVDLENSDLVFIWGANPATDSGPSEYNRVKEAAARGAQTIVIDHRKTQTVRATKGEWVGIRPGTDGALALGMIRVVMEENLYDKEFVEKWTHGFEDLKTYVQQYTLEEVARITGVPPDTIQNMARRLAACKGAGLVMETGLEYADSGVQNIRAVFSLWALTGNYDVPGGILFRPDNQFPLGQDKRLEVPETDYEPIGKKEYPLYHHFRKEAHSMELPKAILEGDPYPVKGLMVFGSSLTTSYPNPDLWRRCYEKLDLLVTVDRFLTGDSLYADYVLPAATLFELESYEIFGHRIQYRERVIEPIGESRTDVEIVGALAQRLGCGALFPKDGRDMIERALENHDANYEDLIDAPMGITSEAPKPAFKQWESGGLRDDGQPGFPTPTGKFEFASSLLKHYGYAPLPEFQAPSEGPLGSPETAKEYPLVFNSGARLHSDFRSQHHNIEGLLRMQREPEVWLHSKDAQARGLSHGDPVFVLSPRGRVPYRLKVTEDIVEGVVEANGGGGSPIAVKAWRDCNVNELTDHQNRDPISGFPVYKALLCEVVPRSLSN
jgi:anaerobic selenocysteine-containing dehydrogenase